MSCIWVFTLILCVVSCAQFHVNFEDFKSLLEGGSGMLPEIDAYLSRVPRVQENFFKHAALTALQMNLLPVLELLLRDYDLDPNTPITNFLEPRPNALTSTLAHKAAHLNNTKALRLLQAYGADFDFQSADGSTPIFSAIPEGNIEALETLIDFGANLDANDKIGSGVIYATLPEVVYSLYKGTTEKNIKRMQIFRILVEHGADVNKIDRINNFPLLKAVGKSLEQVKLLVEFGADVNCVNSRGEYPLYIAVGGNNIFIAEYLVAMGARADFACKDKMSLLAMAVTSTYLPALKWLVSLNACRDINTYESPLPVFIAAKYGKLDVLKYFIEELNVPLDVTTAHGESLAEIAFKSQNSEIIKYVRDVLMSRASQIDSPVYRKAAEYWQYRK